MAALLMALPSRFARGGAGGRRRSPPGCPDQTLAAAVLLRRLRPRPDGVDRVGLAGVVMGAWVTLALLADPEARRQPRSASGPW
jgi:hypothetical protein